MEYIRGDDNIFVLDDAHEKVAQVHFPLAEANIVAITRTFVDDSLRGQGVASRLIQMVCDEMEAKNMLIRPVCPYAVKWFGERPEKNGLLAPARQEGEIS
jgi:predicted GNAT family acetyltransferase